MTPFSGTTDFRLDGTPLLGGSTLVYQAGFWTNYAADVTGIAAAALDTLSGGATYAFNVAEDTPAQGCDAWPLCPCPPSAGACRQAAACRTGGGADTVAQHALCPPSLHALPAAATA